jgi:glycosyltransferase involved in cell wall biosynthesis
MQTYQQMPLYLLVVKGFEIYKELDMLLNKKEYKNIFEFNFIGRLPKNLQLLNTNLMEPLSGPELANELKKNHLYITGSLNEPSGNHHIEAAQCGLPIMYIDSGGIKEYCDGFGVEYIKENLEERLLYTLSNYDDLTNKLESYPRNSDLMSQEFLKFFERLLDEKLQIIAQ